MFFQRYGKFVGGIDVPEEKDSTIDKPISIPEPMECLRILLAPCGPSPAEATVSIDTHVESGQRIATAAKNGIDIFAPLGGTVKSINSKTIELTDLTAPEGIPKGEIGTIWEDLKPQQLHQKLSEGNLPTFRPRTEPLIQWIEKAKQSQIHTLIINAVECQPYVTADHRLLVEFGSEVIIGSAILGQAIGAKKVIIAVDQSRTLDYSELLNATLEYDIQRVALPQIYPIGADNILSYVLTRREIPCGKDPSAIGVAVTGPVECFNTHRWVACGQRLNGRVVTLSGPQVERPGNFFIPYGANAHSLLSPAEEPFILGSPMIGRICPPDAVVGPSTNVILGLDPTGVEVPSQCIRCGWCRDHCPARLNVAVLNDHYELGDIVQGEHLGVLSCVECGVCSYICPARLPLTERTKKLKRAILRNQSSMPLFTTPQNPPESQ
jgi:Na+-translocating ferredoxin:NAD+ oxidoreductase subunit C